MQTNYADTLLNISVTGAMVRLEFGTVAPVPGKDGKQEFRATPTQLLVLPIDGFARAFGMQDAVIKKMLADGVLKDNKVQASAGAQGAPTA